MATSPVNGIADVPQLDAALARTSDIGVRIAFDRCAIQSQQTTYTTSGADQEYGGGPIFQCYQSRHLAMANCTNLRPYFSNTGKIESSIPNDIYVSCSIQKFGPSANYQFTFNGVYEARIQPGGRCAFDPLGIEFLAGEYGIVRTKIRVLTVGDQWGLGQIAYGNNYEGKQNVDLTLPNRVISSVVAGATTTVNTSTNHQLAVGSKVYITGCSGGSWAALNTTRAAPTTPTVVASIPTATQFTTALNSTGFGTYTANTGYLGGDSDHINNIYVYTPTLIGAVTLPFAGISVGILGDSIAYGVNLTGNFNNGFIERALTSANIPWTNMGVSGDTVNSFVAYDGHRLRGAYLGMCTHAIIQYGTNDIAAGRSAAQIYADLVTAATICRIRGVKPFICTVPAKTTSTDSWATTANQTLDANNAVRVALNNLIRANATATGGYYGIYDTANAVEVNSGGTLTQDGGYWKANSPSLTSDGVHPQEQGHILMAVNVITAMLTL